MEMCRGERYLAVPRYPTKTLKTICGCLCLCCPLLLCYTQVDNAARKLVSFVVTGARSTN